MSIFSRKTAPSGPVWQQPPAAGRNLDAASLHALGIQSIVEDNGLRALQVGWRLWEIQGLHENQAWDFLYDGYGLWKRDGASSQDRLEFLSAVFRRASASLRPLPDDFASMSREVLDEQAAVSSAVCFAGITMLDLDDRPETRASVRSAVASVHRRMITPQGFSFLRDAQ